MVLKIIRNIRFQIDISISIYPVLYQSQITFFVIPTMKKLIDIRLREHHLCQNYVDVCFLIMTLEIIRAKI